MNRFTFQPSTRRPKERSLRKKSGRILRGNQPRKLLQNGHHHQKLLHGSLRMLTEYNSFRVIAVLKGRWEASQTQQMRLMVGAANDLTCLIGSNR